MPERPKADVGALTVDAHMSAYRAARGWAAQHGHPQPDDRMIGAALAAFLPVHRQVVLEEAARAVEAERRFANTDRTCIESHARVIRGLAVPAPPTPPGSPPADERATAVETGRAVKAVGICGDQAEVLVFGIASALLCILPSGHAGWHHSEGGADWTMDDTVPPPAAVPGTGDDPPWSVTGWRCGCCERRWEITRKGSWYSSHAEQLDEFVDAWCSSLDELRAKHPDLTPLNVDNVPALLLDHRRQALAVQAGRIALREVNNLREQVEAERDGARAEAIDLTDQLGDLRATVSGAEAERDRLAETIRKVRELHSPEQGWEREWKDPIEALRKGWPPCAGCATVATFTPIGKCRTLAALRVGDIPSPTAPEAAE